MNKTTLAAALLLVAGCDSHGDDHDHGHGHTEAHEEPHEEAPAAAPAPAAASPIEAKLGADTLRLTPAADRIVLSLFDASGAPIAPEGEARVVLTPTSGEEQRVVLTPDGGGWSGAASTAGASGYVAVVSMVRDGQTLTARLAWGDAPTAPAEAPAEPEHEHEEGGDHDHGHGHGH